MAWRNNFLVLDLERLEEAILKEKWTIKIFCDKDYIRTVNIIGILDILQAYGKHRNLVSALIYANDDYNHNGFCHNDIINNYKMGSTEPDSLLDYLIMHNCTIILKNSNSLIDLSVFNNMNNVILNHKISSPNLISLLHDFESSLTIKKCNQFLNT